MDLLALARRDLEVVEWSTDMATKLLDGDEEGYEVFVRSMWADTVRACRLILGDTQDAEEAAQDAFVSVYYYRHTLRQPEKARSWFYQILVHCARKTWRKKQSRVRSREEPLHENFRQADATEEIILGLAMDEALASLPETERMVTVLSYYCNVTDREGAAATGCPLGTYKWRKARALRKLAKLLGDQWPNEKKLREEGVTHA